MSSSGSVAGRAVLAVGLMVGFYVLALAISAALLSIPVAEAVYAHRVHPKIAIICVVGAGTILWSIVPRRDRFTAPGPTLQPAHHPRLFAEIEGVASATGQEMPGEVFLVGDVNAWVAQRGGVMGFFSRRVMGLGLPLLQTLSVSELRAVLAHEFGHFYGGDTRLGPWVHKTRAAIGRTIGGLEDSWLQKPFVWYGNMFLRLSHAVSRRQEYSADALASRIVGSRALTEGLKKIEGAAAAYDAYWEQEVVPILKAGFLPPIADGFHRFASHPRVSSAMEQVVQAGLETKQANPYDTHPPLPERIAAVEHLPAGPDPSGEPRAISLLSDLADLERSWLATAADRSSVDELTAVEWEAVVATVLLPMWRKTIADNAAVVEGAFVGDLARVVCGARERTNLLSRAAGEVRAQDARADLVRWVATVAFLLTLERAGWTVETLPGDPISARRGEEVMRPFEVAQKMADGTLTDEQWRAETSRLGLSGMSLVG